MVRTATNDPANRIFRDILLFVLVNGQQHLTKDSVNNGGNSERSQILHGGSARLLGNTTHSTIEPAFGHLFST